MDVSLTDVRLQHGRSSSCEEDAQEDGPLRLFCLVDRASRRIVGALVSSTVPDEQTIAGLLPESSEKRGEREGTSRDR